MREEERTKEGVKETMRKIMKERKGNGMGWDGMGKGLEKAGGEKDGQGMKMCWGEKE